MPGAGQNSARVGNIRTEKAPNVKRAGIWFVSIAAAVAAAVLGLCLVSPTALLVVALLVAPLFNNSKPPPIAQGVITKEDWPRFEAASKKLTEALQLKFPVGSSEEALKSVLLAQGFRNIEPPPSNCISPGQAVPVGVTFTRCLTPQQEEQRKRTLVYEWGNGVCGEKIFVIWSSNDLGALNDVKGHYSGVCL
jgi:hypothetical protein